MSKEYEIWIEGYSVTGNSSEASFIGKSTGKTFEDACKNYRDNEGKPLKLDKEYSRPSIWACRLFDNEIDARKSFG